MLEALSSPAYAPFAYAMFVLVGLVLLELALGLIGLSSDLDLGDVEAGIEAPDLADVPDLPEAAMAELDLDADVEAPAAEQSAPGVLHALGLGDAPALIWLAALAMSFALAGFALQFITAAVGIGPLGGWLASVIALVPAFLGARRIARFVGGLLPSVETYATSSFHRRRGTVTVGTARKGSPAEVRYLDGFGTTHHLMAEPLDTNDQITAGTEVLILRDRAGKPRLVSLS